MAKPSLAKPSCRGFTRQPENSKCAQGPGASNTTKIPRKGAPRERQKKENCGGRGKKKDRHFAQSGPAQGGPAQGGTGGSKTNNHTNTNTQHPTTPTPNNTQQQRFEGEAHPHAADTDGALLKARADKEMAYPEVATSGRCKLVAIETCGRWSDEAAEMIRLLSHAKAREAPSYMRCLVWTRMLSVTCATAFASSLIEFAKHVHGFESTAVARCAMT